MNRFWNKVDKTDNCWNWTGAKTKGYGAIKINGKRILTHRLSWIIHFGEIPNNLFVCHKCDNPSCVNPEHLFLGTQSDNMQDCKNKNRLVVPDNGVIFKKGDYPKNTSISLEKAIEVKSAILNRDKKSLKNIALEFNVSYQYTKDISCGRILKERNSI